jgi:hypothetical protein
MERPKTNTTQHTISIEKIRPLDKGNLKAFVSVRVNGILINDCRIVQQPGQDPWVSPPQREYEVNGERRFAPIVQFDEDVKKAVQSAVLQSWRKSA